MENTGERIEPDWLTKGPLRGILTAFEDEGFEAFVVGGCVRDALLGRDCNDIDISTNATPDQVKTIMKAHDCKLVPTGVDHGTWTVIKKGRPFEITTYRKDVATDGRRATVEYASTMLEDAERRDFTMNALYADKDGLVYDPVGTGVEDAKAGVVRFVGDADTRCKEDYLRILRLFRFFVTHSQGKWDIPSLNACAENARGLTDVSDERVLAEMQKLLKAPNGDAVYEALSVMQRTGVFYHLRLSFNYTGLGGCLISEKTTGRTTDWRTRFCVAFDGCTDFPLSKKDRRFIETLWNLYRDPSDYVWKAQAVIYGAEVVEQSMLLRSKIVHPRAFEKLKSPVVAEDLMAKGYTEGPALGQAMRAAKEFWLKGELIPDKEACVKQAMKEVPVS